MNVHNNHFLCITILIPMKKRALVKFIKTLFQIFTHTIFNFETTCIKLYYTISTCFN